MMSETDIFCKVLKVNEITRNMDIPGFMTFYCMIAENFCKDNNLDIKEFINDIKTSIDYVNDEFGKY